MARAARLRVRRVTDHSIDLGADHGRDLGAPATPRWWGRLSGAELRRRLTQRGVGTGRAELLVRGRDTDHHAQAIDQLLGGE